MRRTWFVDRSTSDVSGLSNGSSGARLMCFTLDKMLACQMGKPSVVWTHTSETAVNEHVNDSPDDRRVHAHVSTF